MVKKTQMEEAAQADLKGKPGDTAKGPVKNSAKKSTKEPAHYHGHRDRLRARFATSDAEQIADYELLELLLFRLLPRRDTKPIAKEMLKKFKSFSGALSAPDHLLLEIDGIGPTAVTDLKVILAATQRFARDQIIGMPVLDSWSKLIDYCHAQMAYESKEQFRILFLDKKNKLIADEVQQRGTIDHTPVYPREIVKRALEHSATAIIIAHNHPSGDPTPSRADIAMTTTIVEAATPLGITVHDHIIIAKEGHVSFRALKLI